MRQNNRWNINKNLKNKVQLEHEQNKVAFNQILKTKGQLKHEQGLNYKSVEN